jgi:hypothetical protein
MTVFTLLLCGTGLTADRSGEHIAWLGSEFAQNQALKEGRDWLIHDGPGSGYREEDVQKYRNKNFTRYVQTQGWLTGAGSDEIRDNAVAVIKENIDITQVNIVGTSRGAWNAIRVANALAADPKTAHIRVNILAFEPVPGLGNHDLNGLSLPPTVDEYTSFIALHEHSLGFTPIVPVAQNPNTQTYIYTVPGSHSALVNVYTRTAGIDLYSLYALPELTKRSMIRTLHRWGTPIENNTEDDTNLWAEVRAHHAEFEKFRESSYTVVFDSYQTAQDKDGETHYHRKVSTLDDNNNNISSYLPDLGLSHHKESATIYTQYDLTSETCTLHRDFNDSVLLQRAQALLKMKLQTEEESQEFEDLIDFLEARNDSRTAHDLSERIESLKSQREVMLATSEYETESVAYNPLYSQFIEIETAEPATVRTSIPPSPALSQVSKSPRDSWSSIPSNRSSVSLWEPMPIARQPINDSNYYALTATQCVSALCVSAVILTAVFTGGLTVFFGLAALKLFSGYVLAGAVTAPALTYYGVKKITEPENPYSSLKLRQ